MPLNEKDKSWLQQNFTKNSDIGNIIQNAVSAAIAPLQKEITDLKSMLATKDKRISDLELRLKESIKRNSAMIHQRADDNEQYSKKQNIRISGVTFIRDEENGDLEKRVISALGNEGVVIKSHDIFRLHHCGRAHPLNKFKKHRNHSKPNKFVIDENDSTKTAEILIRFTNWRARSAVYNLKHQRDSELGVNLDLTKHRSNQLSTIRQEILDQNRSAYAFVNAECKIVLNDCSESEADPRKIFLDSWQHFHEILPEIKVDEEFGRRQRNRFQRNNPSTWLASLHVNQQFVNIKTNPNWDDIEGIVYIGRGPTKSCPFGNPFKVSRNRSAEQAVSLYEKHVKEDPELKQRIIEAISDAPAVACYCNYPSDPCHYSVIKKVISGDII